MSGGHFIIAACMLAGALVAPFIERALSHVAFPQYEQEVRLATGGGDPYQGRDRIRQYGCDTCHPMAGIRTAEATVGSPLTQVARRVFLAGHIENTPENMMQWIEHPHAYAEKTAMPEMGVTRRDSRDIVAYLYTLK